MEYLVEKNILILGARAPVAIELARSFKRKGVKIILADSLRLPIGRWTNKKDKYVLLPSARHQTSEYIRAISDLVLKYKISDIIPCCEEAFYISLNKEIWKCNIWVSEIKLMNNLHNKESFFKYFKNELNIPKTISLDKFDDWKNSEKYVFKPKYSRFANNIYINTPLDKNTIPNPCDWIAQEMIVGKEICIYSIWSKGDLTGYTCYEPIYKVGNGAGILFKRLENISLKRQIIELGKNNNFEGQISFDVITSNEVNYFIECNPRATSGAHLLNKELYHSFWSLGETSPADVKNYMLTSLMIFTHPRKLLNRKILKTKGVLFRWNDPLPSLLQFLSLLEIIFIKISKKTTLLQATTEDIEWNGYKS